MKILLLLAALLPTSAGAAEHPLAALVREYHEGQYAGGAIVWSRHEEGWIPQVLASTEAKVPGARDALLAEKKSPYIAAAVAYKMKPDPAIVDSLIAVLDGHRDEHDRVDDEQLAAALALIGDKRAVPHLWKAIARFPDQPWEQARFARAIHILDGDRKAVELLVAVSRNSNEEWEKADIPLSDIARQMLVERSPEDIPGIHPVVAALTRITFDQLGPYETTAAGAKVTAVRLEALAASPVARSPGAHEALQARFEKFDDFAGALLWKLEKNPEIVAKIAEHAKEPMADSRVLFALGFIGDPRGAGIIADMNERYKKQWNENLLPELSSWALGRISAPRPAERR